MGLLCDHSPCQVAESAGQCVSNIFESWYAFLLTECPVPRAFFAMLLSLMMPPNMPVQIFLFVSALSESDESHIASIIACTVHPCDPVPSRYDDPILMHDNVRLC